MIIAVADTGPLIHLDEIGALELLSVVDELLIPQTVCEELNEGAVPPVLNITKPKAIELLRALQTETSLFITDAVVERGIALLEQ